MKTAKLSFVLVFCVAMSTTVCAPRGDLSQEEEDGHLESEPRYVKIEPHLSIKKIVDKLKDVVDSKKGVVHKLKKPVQIVEHIKDKIIDKKGHKWTKVEPHPSKPLHFIHKPPVSETVPCVYYPQFDLHYTPPLPYYYF